MTDRDKKPAAEPSPTATIPSCPAALRVRIAELLARFPEAPRGR